MGIQPGGYTIVCDGCAFPIRCGLGLTEALEIIETERDCIVIDGKVYCCEECAEKRKDKTPC